MVIPKQALDYQARIGSQSDRRKLLEADDRSQEFNSAANRLINTVTRCLAKLDESRRFGSISVVQAEGPNIIFFDENRNAGTLTLVDL